MAGIWPWSLNETRARTFSFHLGTVGSGQLPSPLPTSIQILMRGGLHFQFRVIIYILALIGKVGREVMIFMRLSGMGPNGLT